MSEVWLRYDLRRSVTPVRTTSVKMQCEINFSSHLDNKTNDICRRYKKVSLDKTSFFSN